MSYPRFSAMMAERYPSYSWEALPVLSGAEDPSSQYELTTFHVWHPEARNEDFGPVFFQHGMAQDGAQWLETTSVGG